MSDLYERALAWEEGDIPTLEGIMNALQQAYHAIDDGSTERSEFRSACDELLINERLPTFFRSRLLFYKAWTEDNGDEDDGAGGADLEKVREQLDDAMYWCNDVRQTMLETGLQDDRVEQLWDDIIWSRAKLDEYKEDEAEESDEAAEDTEAITPAPTIATAPPPPAPSALGSKLWKKASKLTPEELAAPGLTQEQKLEGANAFRAYERRLLEEARAMERGEAAVDATTSHTTTTTSQYSGASVARAKPMVLLGPGRSQPTITVQDVSPTAMSTSAPSSSSLTQPTIDTPIAGPSSLRAQRKHIPASLRRKQTKAKLRESLIEPEGPTKKTPKFLSIFDQGKAQSEEDKNAEDDGKGGREEKADEKDDE